MVCCGYVREWVALLPRRAAAKRRLRVRLCSSWSLSHGPEVLARTAAGASSVTCGSAGCVCPWSQRLETRARMVALGCCLLKLWVRVSLERERSGLDDAPFETHRCSQRGAACPLERRPAWPFDRPPSSASRMTSRPCATSACPSLSAPLSAKPRSTACVVSRPFEPMCMWAWAPSMPCAFDWSCARTVALAIATGGAAPAAALSRAEGGVANRVWSKRRCMCSRRCCRSATCAERSSAAAAILFSDDTRSCKTWMPLRNTSKRLSPSTCSPNVSTATRPESLASYSASSSCARDSCCLLATSWRDMLCRWWVRAAISSSLASRRATVPSRLLRIVAANLSHPVALRAALAATSSSAPSLSLTCRSSAFSSALSRNDCATF
mmetsp:Transcript_6073/g.10475  ORF Transcript_6073/g.10475 Transcript_6073/m.10475 type:complete len:381 (-) Transcript_6073:610-1752(-)